MRDRAGDATQWANERIWAGATWLADHLADAYKWVSHTTTWERMAGFSFDTWHSLLSAFCWGLTFLVLCVWPIKNTREWTPLAAGLTLNSGILALLLLTTVLQVLWPNLALDGVLRYLFRDVGTIVNVVIILRVLRPGVDSGIIKEKDDGGKLERHGDCPV